MSHSDFQTGSLEYTEPCWLLLYPEGTRFSKEKHEASIEFAREKQIQPMRQHLIPRPKGFHELTTRYHVHTEPVPYLYRFKFVF